LESEGFGFRSRSDTEVLVHLYQAHGPDFVSMLRGMFAIAIWDRPRRRLVLARDHMGVKPLFYAEHDGQLLFASEIKALLVAGLPRKLDPIALHDYLSFDYVPGPRTMFEGIRKLPAGHRLVWEGGDVRIERYWDLPGAADMGQQPASPHQEALSDDPRELAAELRGRLESAVHANMVSDVPVGAFLSGGLDSSLVVALMARMADRKVSTFSIGFKERSYNELPWARRVAAHCGTNHHETVVEPDVEDIVHGLVEAFDEPFADSSAIASWVVAREAGQHAKVVLSGDGGDEIFGGYVIYQADRLARLYRKMPSLLTERTLPALARRIPSSEKKMSLDLKARRFIEFGTLDPLAAHGSWRLIFTEEMKRELYAADFKAATHDSLDRMREPFDAYPGDDLLNRFMAVDSKVSLVDDMLTKVDRTSMAHSLEVRVPLLDHHLVELMTRIPSRHKVPHATLRLKAILKNVSEDYLPKDVVHRKKAGFHVPIPRWLRHDLLPLVEHQLGRETVARQGIFDPDVVEALVSAHMAGRINASRRIWGLLMFGVWFERWME
jgi:asparagine synthase (glutamine-hydrolysing)